MKIRQYKDGTLKSTLSSVSSDLSLTRGVVFRRLGWSVVKHMIPIFCSARGVLRRESLNSIFKFFLRSQRNPFLYCVVALTYDRHVLGLTLFVETRTSGISSKLRFDLEVEFRVPRGEL